MKIDKKLIKELVDNLDEFKLSELEYQSRDTKIKVTKWVNLSNTNKESKAITSNNKSELRTEEEVVEESSEAPAEEEVESKVSWREDVLLRVMAAADIDVSERDAFVVHAENFDLDENGYIKKAEREADAKAWKADVCGEEEVVAEEAPAEAPAEVAAEEAPAAEAVEVVAEEAPAEEPVAEAEEPKAE